MANIINASKTSTTGLVQTADGSGVLQLQADGTTGLTVGTGGVLTAANGIVMSSMTLGTATAGEFEYDGKVPYFTPLGTQRGIVPGMQYYVLNSTYNLANASGAQSMLGVGVTLSSATRYYIEMVWAASKTSGTTSHTSSISFGGTATVTDIGVWIQAGGISQSTLFDTTNDNSYQYYLQTTSASMLNGASTNASTVRQWRISGTVNINVGGTFIPQVTFSSAPGGVYTVAVGTYMYVYPIGASGSNVSVGTWA